MKKEDLEKLSTEELDKLSEKIDKIKYEKRKKEEQDLSKWENRNLGKLQAYINEIEKYYKEHINYYGNHGTWAGRPTLALVIKSDNCRQRMLPIMELLRARENRMYLWRDMSLGFIATEEEFLEAVKFYIKSSEKFKLALREHLKIKQ